MDATTFWSAVGAIGTVAAAIIALLAYLWQQRQDKGGTRRPDPPAPSSVRKIAMKGRMIGEKKDCWDLEAALEIEGTRAKGKFHWLLVECPRELAWAKHTGKAGFEFVEGTFDPDGLLTLQGYKVDNTELLWPDKYKIVIAHDWSTFEGHSWATRYRKPYETGHVKGSVSILPAG